MTDQLLDTADQSAAPLHTVELHADTPPAESSAPASIVPTADGLERGDRWANPLVLHADGSRWYGGWEWAYYAGNGQVVLTYAPPVESRLHVDISVVVLSERVERTGVVPGDDDAEAGAEHGDKFVWTRAEAEDASWEHLRWLETRGL